ncbi:MAG: hypothetical protein R6U55_05205 [Desulfovermiculus sp.]
MACESLDNQTLQRALSGMHQRIGRATAQKYRELPEGPDLRFQGQGNPAADPRRPG